jgi:stalled ribosome rescue protein Dom34
MSIKAGLWIDHRKAVVVVVTEAGEEINQILSKAEKQLRRTGSTPLQGNFESQQVPADDSRQRTFTGQLNNYYDEVIAYIRDAESILIFGPGVAKDELKVFCSWCYNNIFVSLAGRLTLK